MSLPTRRTTDPEGAAGLAGAAAADLETEPAPTVARLPASRVLVVDDEPRNLRLLAALLGSRGYAAVCVGDAEQALRAARAEPPDLFLVDVVMPGMDGLALCRALRADPLLRAVPIVVVTLLDDRRDRLAALDAGADDFLSKPIDGAELFARIRALLRAKHLYDEVRRQSLELERWSRTLEARVALEVGHVERLSRLKRFLSPALADRIVQCGDDDPLAAHRREVTVLFADLRGFTAFAEAFEANAVMAVLGEFHACMGALIQAHEGTLERFTGDGMMVFFNDPQPIDDHAGRAVALARGMMTAGRGLARAWRAVGIDLALAVGLSRGVATLGAIGFDSRVDYAAIGRVTNLASRLCAEAAPWEILACESVQEATARAAAPAVEGRTVALKGFAQPVRVFTIAAAAA